MDRSHYKGCRPSLLVLTELPRSKEVSRSIHKACDLVNTGLLIITDANMCDEIYHLAKSSYINSGGARGPPRCTYKLSMESADHHRLKWNHLLVCWASQNDHDQSRAELPRHTNASQQTDGHTNTRIKTISTAS